MRMMKKNKQSMARETVYDRCAYVGCYNGKYINGRRLFHFPAETDRRLEMWIERSGNFRLRTWAATSLRKAGLCADHFDDISFTNSTRKALRRNVVPRHYTEDLKYRKAQQENNKMEEETAKSEMTDDPLKCERFSPVPFVDSDSRNDVPDEFSSHTEEYKNNLNKKTSTSRSPSPMVEYIVEELDENLINENSRVAESSDEKAEEYNDKTESQASFSTINNDETFLDEETDVTSEKFESPVTYQVLSAEELKMDVLHEDIENVCDEDLSSQNECDNELYLRTDNVVTKLQEENRNLREMIRIFKRKLRRSKGQEANCTQSTETMKNIDEFLNLQECTSPVARAIVKLILHKVNLPYTKEEKECAIFLYENSPATFVCLKKSGCNFPGKNTMKKWLSEEKEDETNYELVIVGQSMENIENIHGYKLVNGEEVIEENCLIDNEINCIPGLKVVIADNEGVDLVEPLGNHIGNAEIYHEYIEALPPENGNEQIIE